MQLNIEKYDGYFYITTYNPSYTIIKNKISKAYPGMDFRMGEQLGSGLYTPPKNFTKSLIYIAKMNIKNLKI